MEVVKSILKAVLMTIFVTVIGGLLIWLVKKLCSLWQR